jgi:chemotaxis protein histidine kinase CheA
MTGNSWDAKLAERKVKFIAKSRERLHCASSLLAALPASPDWKEDARLVFKHLHQIGGGGGLYGMTELCDLAIEAETMVQTAIQSDATDARVFQKVQTMIDRLEEMLVEH